MTIQSNIPLSPYTTIGLGGNARFFAICSREETILEGVTHARRERLRVHVLGGGSNTIFADGGFDGLVLYVALKGIEFTDRGPDVLVRAAAGEFWDRFVATCIDHGLGGLECMSGIPGLVGATPMQNVGAYGQEVSESIFSVEALDRTSLQPVVFSNTECQFGYRTSRFKQEDANRYVITAVTFALTPCARPSPRYPELQRAVEQSIDLQALGSGRPALAAIREAVLGLRRKKSMIVDPADPDARSAGSFFTNPVVSPATFEALENLCKSRGHTDPIPHFLAGLSVKIPAAWLVEQAGFPKGYQRGKVGVSRHHALALVNRGGSTAELLSLAVEIESAVQERFGLHLTREPVIVQ